MSPEQEDLLKALNRDLALIKSSVKVRKKKGRVVAVEELDGGGKIFEAFIAMQLKLYFDQASAETQICDAAGEFSEVYLLRGGPGHLRRSAAGSNNNEPGFVSITFDNENRYELHNSVEWPDHFDGEGETHELDVSFASKDECDTLSNWYTKLGDAPRPVMGIEAKFHGRPPEKEIARGVTGLAARLGVPMVYLVTSQVPSDIIVKQLQSLKGKRFENDKVAHAGAFEIRLSGAKIVADGLANAADELIKYLKNN